MEFYKGYIEYVNEAAGDRKNEKVSELVVSAEQHIEKEEYVSASRDIDAAIGKLYRLVKNRLNKNSGDDYNKVKSHLIQNWNKVEAIVTKIKEYYDSIENSDEKYHRKIGRILFNDNNTTRIESIKRESKEETIEKEVETEHKGSKEEDKEEPQKEVHAEVKEDEIFNFTDSEKESLLNNVLEITSSGTNTKNVEQKRKIQRLINGLIKTDLKDDGMFGGQSQAAMLELKKKLSNVSEVKELVSSDINPNTKELDGFMRIGTLKAIITMLGGDINSIKKEDVKTTKPADNKPEQPVDVAKPFNNKVENNVEISKGMKFYMEKMYPNNKSPEIVGEEVYSKCATDNDIIFIFNKMNDDTKNKRSLYKVIGGFFDSAFDDNKNDLAIKMLDWKGFNLPKQNIFAAAIWGAIEGVGTSNDALKIMLEKLLSDHKLHYSVSVAYLQTYGVDMLTDIEGDNETLFGSNNWSEIFKKLKEVQIF